MRQPREQQPVLRARRLGLAAVDDDRAGPPARRRPRAASAPSGSRRRRGRAGRFARPRRSAPRRRAAGSGPCDALVLGERHRRTVSGPGRRAAAAARRTRARSRALGRTAPSLVADERAGRPSAACSVDVQVGVQVAAAIPRVLRRAPSNCWPSSEVIWPSSTDGSVASQVDLAAGHRQPAAVERARRPAGRAAARARRRSACSARSTIAPPGSLGLLDRAREVRRERPRELRRRASTGAGRGRGDPAGRLDARARAAASSDGAAGCRRGAPSPAAADRRGRTSRAPERRCAIARRPRALRSLRSRGFAIRAHTAISTAATHAAVSASIHHDLRVAAGAEPVEHRDRPARVREPVDRPPRAVAEAPAQQARDHERDEQVERERAEPEPQRPVRRRERDHGVEQPDRRKAVEHARRRCAARAATSTSSETSRCSASIVNRGHRARPRSAPSPRTPSTTLAVSSSERHRPRAAGEVPVGARCACRAARAATDRARTPRSSPLARATRRRAGRALDRDEPARQTERLEPCRRPRSPRMIEAVLAMFASRHEPAATLTVRQSRRRADPVAGSTRWCATPSLGRASAHGRARGGQAAGSKRDPLPRGIDAGAMVVGDAHAPAAGRGAGPATAMSPPKDDEHAAARGRRPRSAARSAASALAAAPRSSATPRAHADRAGVGVELAPSASRGPATIGIDAGRRRRTRRAKSRSYPSAISASPTVGSTSPSVNRAARSAAATASISSGLTCTASPARGVDRGQLGVVAEPRAREVEASTTSVTAARAAVIRRRSVTPTTAVLPNA